MAGTGLEPNSDRVLVLAGENLKDVKVKLILALGIVIVLAGVLALAAMQGSPDVTGPSEIVLEDMRFSPNRLDMKVGQALVVRLMNRGTYRHDLNFPSLHMPGLEGIEAILEPGESRTISLRFDEPVPIPSPAACPAMPRLA